MNLHFDPNQQYQLDAINSVTKLFEGQPLNKSEFELSGNGNTWDSANWDSGIIFKSPGKTYVYLRKFTSC